MDWDGTLLDSFSAQVNATRAVFELYGVPWSDARFAAFATDWRGHYLAAGIDEMHLADASAAYRRAYEQQQTRLRPFARLVLRRLSKAGIPLAMVTSGARERVERELRHRKLQAIFAEVITYEDVRRPKPSPEGFQLALDRLRLGPGEVAAIGDTGVDAMTAEAAGVRHLLIRSRYTTAPYLHESLAGWRAVERLLRRTGFEFEL